MGVRRYSRLGGTLLARRRRYAMNAGSSSVTVFDAELIADSSTDRELLADSGTDHELL